MNLAIMIIFSMMLMHLQLFAEEEVFTNQMFKSAELKKDQSYRIRLMNGDILTGQYKEKGDNTIREDSAIIESIVMKTIIGDITLYADELLKIDQVGNAYRHSSSLYFMPTGDAIGKNAYVSLTQLAFAQCGFGFENISINGGITLIPGLSFDEQGKHVNVKYTFYEEQQDIIPGHYTLAGGYSLIYANSANVLQHAYMTGSFHMPRTTLTTALFFKTGSNDVYEASAGRWGSGIIRFNNGSLGFGLGFDVSLTARHDTKVIAELWCSDIMRPRNSAGFLGLRLCNDRYSMDAGLAMFTAPAIIPAVKIQWLPFQ
ncbi:MAG: hypothetical protein ACO3YM_05425 [Candidatus Kapaibacteriota bacterium]